jgi:hypothetical protein
MATKVAVIRRLAELAARVTGIGPEEEDVPADQEAACTGTE